ncbi:terminase large subunit [Salipiger pacificus]|nr:terminase large subunit [Alloyangia pacifica]
MTEPDANLASAQALDLSAWPWVERGHGYALDVVSGKIDVCRHVRNACRRWINDLHRGEDFPFHFDPDVAERAMEFAGLLPNIKGPMAGQPVQLMPWQAFVYMNLFGWIETAGGARRYRQGVVWVPRGNGKTTVAAPLALYLTFMDGEGGAEGYAAAVTRDQAKILFDTAHAMVSRTKPLQAKFGIETSKHSVYQLRSSSVFKAVSSDAKALDGLNVQVGVCDEIGSHKTAEVYNVLLTAMGKRKNPMLVSISTATGNNAGIGKQLWDYGVKVLDGIVDDDRFFTLIYTIDEGDDIWSEDTWRKANPSWGVSVQPDAIRAIASQAKSSASQEAIFQTRHLNIWLSSDQALFSPSAWRANRVPGLRLEDFEGEPCYGGIDLSTKTDLAGLSLIFPFMDDDHGERVAIFGQAFLPQLAVDEARAAVYPEWARKGKLIVTPGDVTDFQAIEDHILDLNQRFQLRDMAFDPWSATQLAQRLMGEGVNMTEFRATTANFSEPTKELEAMIIAGKCIHDDDQGPLSWCISNVVGHYDARQNVYPRRERKDQKIDVAIATIMAIGRYTLSEGVGSIWNSEDERPEGLLII